MAASPLNERQQDMLLVVAQVCATLSLLGSLFILLCFARFPHLRKLSFTLVAWLAVADLGEYYHSYFNSKAMLCVTIYAIELYHVSRGCVYSCSAGGTLLKNGVLFYTDVVMRKCTKNNTVCQEPDRLVRRLFSVNGDPRGLPRAAAVCVSC